MQRGCGQLWRCPLGLKSSGAGKAELAFCNTLEIQAVARRSGSLRPKTAIQDTVDAFHTYRHQCSNSGQRNCTRDGCTRAAAARRRARPPVPVAHMSTSPARSRVAFVRSASSCRAEITAACEPQSKSASIAARSHMHQSCDDSRRNSGCCILR